MEDTIAAISTASGTGAISIVRMSGKDAIEIANKLFPEKDLKKSKSHSIHYGHIVYNTETIDEVLLMLMKAPATYTTEDIIEINCHGGISTTNKILEILLKSGARLAEPGEFTKRAFLNGRINLLEAESVEDLIKSKSDEQRKMALNGLNGRLSNIIKEIRNNELELLANIAVNIDYPEYDDAIEVTKEILEKQLIKIKNQLELLLKNANIGKIIKTGIDISLIGRPNVGKSSLLNALVNADIAIVTDISGTTRDIIEEKIYLEGIELNIKDTAGIRDTSDVVEKMGVERSKKTITTSDLVILVLNNNEPLTEEDKKLLEEVENITHLIFINKDDLETKLKLPKNIKYIKGNTKDLKGLEALKNEIIRLYNLDKISSKDSTYLSNIRQINLVNKALEDINTALEENKKQIPVDILETYIRSSWETLGVLIGENYEDELIDKLFKNFCLGK